MGIRLDWEVEAEQSHRQRAGEDPQSARQRRTARLRLVLSILLLLALFAAGVIFVWTRLQALEGEIEQELRSTVEAEVATLRLGDFTAFSEFQRSASSEWLQAQQQLFNQYQDLKLQSAVQLTGQITSVEVESPRARVKVEEIINGVPYQQVWFYWRYDDGWHHVPPDYTFWGASTTLDRQGLSIQYREVDQALAVALADTVASWLTLACNALTCSGIPTVQVDIIADPALQIGWSNTDPWRLILPSPYVYRARADLPFDGEMQRTVANLLANRLVTTLSPRDAQQPASADSVYLRQSIINWLAGRFAQVDTQAYLLNSLSTLAGDAIIGRLLSGLQPMSDLTLLGQITATPTEQLALDWRDYLTWKLGLEKTFIQNQDEANYLLLYDTRDEATRTLAYSRFTQPVSSSQPLVASVQRETLADGRIALQAMAQDGGEALTEVRFVWVDGTWKRAN